MVDGELFEKTQADMFRQPLHLQWLFILHLSQIKWLVSFPFDNALISDMRYHCNLWEFSTVFVL